MTEYVLDGVQLVVRNTVTGLHWYISGINKRGIREYLFTDGRLHKHHAADFGFWNSEEQAIAFLYDLLAPKINEADLLEELAAMEDEQ